MNSFENCNINKLNPFNDEWKNVRQIIPYGCGLEAYRSLKRIITEFDVPFIIDKDSSKSGKKFMEIPVFGLEALKHINENQKIVITIAKRRYKEIKLELEQYDLVENVNFCHISQFAVEWYYKYKNEYNIFSMDIAITTKCTLRCKNCNMFTNYYETPVTYTFDEIKENLDLFFTRIDYIWEIGILGGEALLNKDLIEIIKYLNIEYSDRFGTICITTNGSIIPDEKVLLKLREYNIIMIISDYKYAIEEKIDIDNLAKLFNDRNIICQIRRDLVWCDFGFPNKPANIPGDKARKHMLECNPGWRGLNDKKFYFCNVAWSADKAGLYKLKKEDYVDLTELKANSKEDKLKLLKYSLGIMPNGYMSFCQVCGGCGVDNEKFVNAGEQ